MALNSYLQLLRVPQWYKNLVVFLAIFFSGNVLNFPLLSTTVLAFFSLCLISSAGYIINDIIDRKSDQLHPENKHRPLATGVISPALALVIVFILLGIGVWIGATISIPFLSLLAALFVLTLLYTFLLKKIIIADVLAISILFVLRALAGAVAIQVIISPWLVLVPFFLALFLAIGKRHSELLLLKEKAPSARKVLQEYTLSLTNSLMGISTSLLVISYALYSFLSPFNHLLYTLPFALYVIFRYYILITSGSIISRHPEKIVKDALFITGIVLWTISTAFIIYL
ncbi:MAG: UbiA family prenyltransferase [Nanoarchaeota archaeon]